MLWDMHSSRSLLPQPISELRRSLEMKKAIQADVEQLDSSFIASDSSLWVDKYAPQRFRELLSNEVSSTLAQKTIQLSHVHGSEPIEMCCDGSKNGTNSFSLKELVGETEWTPVLRRKFFFSLGLLALAKPH